MAIEKFCSPLLTKNAMGKKIKRLLEIIKDVVCLLQVFFKSPDEDEDGLKQNLELIIIKDIISNYSYFPFQWQ